MRSLGIAFLLFVQSVKAATTSQIITDHLQPDIDWVVPYYRDKELMTHFRSIPPSAVVGAQYLMAAGVAQGLQLQGTRGVVYVSGGDGSTGQGDFYEALNYSALHRLPLIFLIYDDGWAYGMPTLIPAESLESLCAGRSDLAVVAVDGSNLPTLNRAMEQAVSRARTGTGPSLIIVKVAKRGITGEWDPPEFPADSDLIFLGQKVAIDFDTSGRCINTPLAESTILGVTLGLSLAGFHRPIAQIQDSAFLWLAAHQLREINRLNPAPLVIRVPYGAFSFNPAAALSHFTNLHICLPSNRNDASQLLASALTHSHPVVFLEHPQLYETTGSGYSLPLNKAAVAREGSDLTVVAWGEGVASALDLATHLALDLEVIDLRSAAPIDIDTILVSVGKTNHLWVASDPPQLGAEIIAQAVEKAFSSLHSPPTRIDFNEAKKSR